MKNEIYLTPEGKKQLEEKLKFYKEVERPRAINAIGVAREFGDLKENSEYDQAKEEQGRIEAEILQMEATLRDAIVVTKKQLSNDKIGVGSTVKVFDELFEEELVYKIVGTTESDPIKGFISNQSPVGQALLGKAKGDIACVQTPQGPNNLKVLEII